MAVTESVKIVFEVDDKALVSTVAQLQAIGKVSQEDAAKFNQLSAASKAAGASLEGASKGAEKLATASKDVAKSTAEVAKSAGELKDVGSSLDGAGQAAGAAGEGFVSLSKQIKEANLELQQLQQSTGGVGPEFDAAKQKVFDLEKQLGDLNKEVALTDPKNKAAAFQAFGQSVLGAFQVATGALQAFGVENEKAQEIAQKLQGALNIVEGISSITKLKDTFQDLSKVLGFTTAAQTTLTTATTAGSAATGVASGAMRGFAAALASTGIGAIVVALGALAGAFLLSSSNADKETEATKRLKEANADLVKIKNANYIKSLEIAALSDPSKQGLLEAARLELDANEKIAAAKAKVIELENKRESQTSIFNFDANAITETIKELDVAKKTYNATVFGAGQDFLKFQLQSLNDQKNKAEEDAKKAAEEAKQKAEEARQRAKQLSEEQKQQRIQALQDEIALIEERQKAALVGVDDEIQRIAIVNSFRLSIYEKQIEKAALTNESIKVIDEKYATETKQLFKDLFAAIETAREEDVENADKANQEKIASDQKLIDNKRTVLSQEQELENLKNQLDVANIADKEQRERELAEKNFKTQEKFLLARIDLEKQASAEQNKLLAELDEARSKQVISEEEYEKKRTEILAKGGNDQEKLLAQLALLYKQYEQGKTDDAEKGEGERTQIAAEAAQEAFDFIFELNQQSFQRETEELEKQKEQGLITEEQYQEKLRALKNKQARADKEAAIFNATIQFSQALINALTTTPSTAAPAALALAAAVAGLNLAKIIATPLPKFKKGTLAVPGTDTGDDSVMAMLRPGEAVIPTEINREYANTIKAIYTRKVSSKELNEFVNSRMSVVRDEPVFNFNPVTLDALFKRDIRVSQMSSAVQRSSGGTLSTINVKADVDTYALGKVISKNKSMEVTNVESIGEAVAEALSRRTNRRQQI